MIKAVLFDMDGTIVDSEAVAFETIVECMEKWRLSVDREDAALVAGKKWDVAFEHLNQKYSIPVSKEEMRRQVLERYRERLNHNLVVIPGVVEAIRALAPHFGMALVSGSDRHDIHFVLRQLKIEQCFSIVLGAEDYPFSKPAPDGFRLAMQLLNVKPAETLVFEDSSAGIASGLAAGARVVAVTSTNHFAHDQSGAHAHIADFHKVTPEWVRGQV